MKSLTPNRVVAIATALLGLAAAVAVPLASLDWSSTAGVIAGLGTVLAVASKWLEGWQAHEARVKPAVVQTTSTTGPSTASTSTVTLVPPTPPAA